MMARAFLLDLDGTLYTDAGAVAGGPAAIARLRTAGARFRCVTNTTSRARLGLVERLANFGYEIRPEEILTPVSAAVALCREKGMHRVLAFVPEAALSDLTGLELVDAGGELPDAVILGDLGDRWNFTLLQQAFTAVMGGAALLALSKDRYFLTGGRLTLDAGPFVAGIEYATGRTAMVVGKPSAAFYQAAVASLDADAGSVVMVGDDLWSDIQGAQQVGLTAWLVRTGKFREDRLRDSGIVPERVIESIAEIWE
jgi:phospholysine phosphohistidine inorganic pyrophosphate phosphatase